MSFLPIVEERAKGALTVKAEVVGSHEKLEAQLGRNLHVWHILVLAVLVPVVEVLYHLLEDHAT